MLKRIENPNAWKEEIIEEYKSKNLKI